MKNKIKLLIFAVVLAAICLIYIGVVGKNYTVVAGDMNSGLSYENVKAEFSSENVVSLSSYEQKDGRLYLTFSAVAKGETDITVTYTRKDSRDGSETPGEDLYFLKVHTGNIITEGFGGLTVNFSGYRSIILAIAIFSLVTAIWLFTAVRRETKKLRYSYTIMTRVGLMLFLTGLVLVFVPIFILSLMKGYEYNMITVYTNIASVALNLVVLTMPIVFIFSVLLSISNVALIEKEGFGLSHMVGILLSLALTVGCALCFFSPGFQNNSGGTIFYGVAGSVICYFECMLAGACYCGLYAGNHKLKPGNDFIVILGCGIDKDGSLLPLLRGRVDKALEYYNMQLKATGKKAVFVPSGGKGSDECISEAEAMKRYLMSKGIEEEQILCEDKSVSTYENMKFSKAKIEAYISAENAGEAESAAKVCFSTTNYHVFRSGVFANQVGLYAKGMGSKTKWYFWPNAFVREFIGMLVTEKKSHIIMLAAVILLSLILEIVIGH